MPAKEITILKERALPVFAVENELHGQHGTAFRLHFFDQVDFELHVVHGFQTVDVGSEFVTQFVAVVGLVPVRRNSETVTVLSLAECPKVQRPRRGEE